MNVAIRSKFSPVWEVISKLTPLELFSLVTVLVCIFLMVFGPSVAPYPPEVPHPEERLLPPSASHWFGTDENGMDVLSRIIAAPRVDIFIGLMATLLSVFVGTPLGVIAGIFEGSGRRIASLIGEGTLRLLDVMQAFPVFILALVLVAIRGPSVGNILAAIAFVNSPVFLRLARAEMLSLRERTYAEAARSIGNTDSAVAFKHLLPNALPPLLSQVSVTVGFAILLTSGLSFVGAGVEPPTPELGGMISTGAKSMILGFWWPALFPGIALGLIVFTFSITGDALGRLLEPGDEKARAAKGEGIVDQRVERAAVATSEEVQAISSIEQSEAGSVLTVKGLTVEFPQADGYGLSRVLDNVALSISLGEIVGVIGGPGAGKSVLVRSLLALPPEGAVIRGQVRFRGRDLLTMPPDELKQLRGTGIAHILPGAKAQLNPVLRIGEMMIVVIRAHMEVSRKEARERAAAALRAVGIMDPEKRLAAYPHELSGGMAQRVCIALALIHNPILIVADEPTFGLDVTVQRQVLDLMADLASRRGFAQLLVTRDLGIVAQYCQRVFVMQAGRIIESGPTMDLFRQPRQPYTQQLIASVKTRR
jgi:peptide/nickel transport system permease protein